MKIALIQQHAGPSVERNIERGVAHFKQAVASGAELIVYPEVVFQRFFPQHKRQGSPYVPDAETIPGPLTDRFSRLAREAGVVTVLNLYEQEGDHRYDASPVIDADGSLLGVTRMLHIMDGPGFHEQDYYDPGDRGVQVYETAVGRLGVAICYDRHYPEVMRALGVGGADLVVVPQAGAVDEWPGGLFEAELQVAAMQNGFFTALANRVGEEDSLTFAGESFVTDPRGQVIARGPRGEDAIVLADLDFSLLADCPARRHFLKDRRPEIYPLK